MSDNIKQWIDHFLDGTAFIVYLIVYPILLGIETFIKALNLWYKNAKKSYEKRKAIKHLNNYELND